MGGDGRQGPEPSHRAFVHKKVKSPDFDVNPVNTTQTKCFHSFHLFCSVALITSVLTCLPKLFLFLWVCLSSPHPVPPLPFCGYFILRPDHFLQQKNGQRLSPFFLPAGSLCLLLFLSQAWNPPRPQWSITPHPQRCLGPLCTRHPSRKPRSPRSLGVFWRCQAQIHWALICNRKS